MRLILQCVESPSLLGHFFRDIAGKGIDINFPSLAVKFLGLCEKLTKALAQIGNAHLRHKGCDATKSIDEE